MPRRPRTDILLGLVGALLAGCGSGSGQKPGGHAGSGGLAAGYGGSGGGSTSTVQAQIPGKINYDLDLLFMIDNSPEMTTMQQKFLAQVPQFFSVLEMLPGGLPNLHVAVVSSDLGAPGDSTSQLACTTGGDGGQFQSMPRGTCTSTTLASGWTYLSDVGGQANFTDPIESVFQCIGQLGDTGCGFEHQLASITRALGADGSPPPASNAGFLRPDAYLGIIILTNEDDCSAPPDTTIYSLNGGAQSITNPDGPLTNYRCNGGPRGGHVCTDPSTGQAGVVPLTPPSEITGNPPPVLQLADCQDNDTGSSALIPVDQFVQDIKRLKTDPDDQVMVAAITAPTDPYGVVWMPPMDTPGAAGEVWPQVMHSCGPRGAYNVNPEIFQSVTDGSFGDPSVRITQFVKSFASSTIASICDANYRSAMTAIATKLGGMFTRPWCVATGTVQLDVSGNPACTVTTHILDSNGNTTDVAVPNCNENRNAAPCWLLESNALCAAGSMSFTLMPPYPALTAPSFSSTLTCSVCQPGAFMPPGC
jgi:hypothetical protein